MDKTIEKKLQSMLNKNWQYGMHVITFKGYDVNEEKERVYLHTNERDNHWDRPFDGVSDFLKQFKPVDAEGNRKQSDLMLMGSTDLTAQLKGILLDNIEKVKENRDYIPQATTINNNVNSLINLTKLQLDYVKTSQKFKEGGQ